MCWLRMQDARTAKQNMSKNNISRYSDISYKKPILSYTMQKKAWKQ